jgi:DNA topoisomerase-1
LIITEKPDAASRIAAALDAEGKAKKEVCSGVPIYHAYRDRALVVVPALGHLYTVSGRKTSQRGYPVFDYEWVPRYVAEKKASRIRVWLKVISEFAKDADDFVDACDFDVEGSLIGYCILKYACSGKEQVAKRMRYSTLTTEDLQRSYESLQPHLDFALIEAGLTRHEVDWLYGINLSRALTSAVKKVGKRYAVLSTGRVQGPTLKFLADREAAIGCFVPIPFWTATAKLDIGGVECKAEYGRSLETEQEAKELAAACKTGTGEVESIKNERFFQPPPFPFDSGSLQSEAYRIFKLTPIRTSNIAQHLYLDALISYPRTSSQKLPPSIGYRSILGKLGKAPSYAKQAAELLSKPMLKPNEGAKFDTAHPAIYPTGNLPEKSLGASERNVLDLIIRRFLAVFGGPAVREKVTVSVNINGHNFYLNGIRTLSEGWIRLYKPYVQVRDVPLPPVAEKQKVTIKEVAVNSDFTSPPPRFNPRSLLLKMEKENIGTKATRPATIQVLQDRRYICGRDSFEVSELGLEVSETLTDYCPTIVSPQLTRNLEEKMDDIQEGKETKQAVLEEAISVL